MIFYPCYFQANNEKKPKKCTAKGKLVKSKRIDYANIMWPRDGLYVCYKEQVPFINYVSKEMVEWVGSENGNFCLLVQYINHAHIIVNNYSLLG